MSSPLPPSALDAQRARARELHSAGRLPEAIKLQVDVINAAAAARQLTAADYHGFGVMLFAAKDFAAAASAFEFARKQQADYPDVSLNLGLSLILAGRSS